MSVASVRNRRRNPGGRLVVDVFIDGSPVGFLVRQDDGSYQCCDREAKAFGNAAPRWLAVDVLAERAGLDRPSRTKRSPAHPSAPVSTEGEPE